MNEAEAPPPRTEVFYVFWRPQDETEFFCTMLTLPTGMMNHLTNNEVARMCYAVEWPNIPNIYNEPDPESCDMIEIISGYPTFHMK